MSPIKLSILDQTMVRSGSTARQALQETARLAVVAEGLGYDKFWVSEHHNIPEIAGPSPELLIAYLAGQTTRMSFGSAGIMLPNYSMLKVAENFRLLENLFPGRIHLGIGRAAGTDRLTAHELNPMNRFSDEFAGQFAGLSAYLSDSTEPGTVHERIKAFPYSPTIPPIWILSSGGGSSQLAAANGTALSFAHFINPHGGPQIIADYKANFRPSGKLRAPLANVGVFAFTSEDEEKIERWQVEFDYRLIHIDSGRRFPIPPYEEIKKMVYTEQEKRRIAYNRDRMLSGKPNEIKEKIVSLAKAYGVDEVIISTMSENEQDKLNSFALLADVFHISNKEKPSKIIY